MAWKSQQFDPASLQVANHYVANDSGILVWWSDVDVGRGFDHQFSPRTSCAVTSDARGSPLFFERSNYARRGFFAVNTPTMIAAMIVAPISHSKNSLGV